MIKLNKVLSVALLATVVVLSSCSKEEESVNKTQALTGKSWIVTKMEMGYAGQTHDVTNDMEDCEKDNTIKFNADGKYEENIGSNDCDGEEVNDSGTWKWNSDETALTLTIGGETIVGKVLSISASSLKLEVTEEWDFDSDGVTDGEAKMTTTFKAQ